ncbi:hypothetical protein ACJX0J_013932, partial [Zea mays]
KMVFKKTGDDSHPTTAFSTCVAAANGQIINSRIDLGSLFSLSIHMCVRQSTDNVPVDAL